MDMLKNLASFLNDSSLVALFQRSCGIEIHSSKSVANGSGKKHLSTDADDEDFKKGFQKAKTETQELIFKSSMSNNVNFTITSQWLYRLACFGAFLGNESFYCYFFPYWFWNIDGYVCRRVVLIWSISLYVGQYIKDLVCWPRPCSPPVAKLEQRYELEYGMPSTHATVGFAIPFSLLLLTGTRYEYNWWIMFALCIAWTAVVSFSRIYLGMHSVLDVLVGIALGAILLCLSFPWLDIIDNFQLMHPASPYVMTMVPLLLSFVYPTLSHWSTARGDTTMLMACSAGVSFASWLAVKHKFYSIPMALPPYPVRFPDFHFWLTTFLRMCLGGAILAATRSGFKFVTYRIICWLQGLNHKDAHSIQKLSIELPYKFITYSVVAFSVVYVCPLVFNLVGIRRVTDFTEL